MTLFIIMPDKNKKFVIIDGNAIIHRAYHALPPLTAKDGTMVNAVYGFTSMLLKVINGIQPEYLAVSFDVAGGTFRDEIYKDYKATRVKADQDLYDQIPLCHEIVEIFDIPIYTRKGYEADDVIGTVAHKLKSESPKLQTIIITGDMDILQLVDDNTKVHALRKGMSDIVIYDAKTVKEKYGFGPEHVIDYKALRGDTSDNIPGVRGIGDKTAKELISKFGSLENIYKKYKDDTTLKPNVIKKLEEGKEDAKMSKKLATIIKDVKKLNFKLEDCAVKKFDTAKISELFKKFEFYSMLKRVPGIKNSSSSFPTRGGQRGVLAKKKKLIEINSKNFSDLEKELTKQKTFACKEIISGTDILTSDLLSLVFVTPDNFYHLKLDSNKSWQSIFQNEDYTIVGHNLKQLIKALMHHSCESRNLTTKKDPRFREDDALISSKLFDVMISSHLLNSSTRAHDLKSILLRETDEEAKSISDQTSLFGPEPEAIAHDLYLLLEVKNKHEAELEKTENLGLFQKIEMPLIPVLAEMELNGIAVDKKTLSKLSKQVGDEIKRLTKKIHSEAGEEFNIASSVQLRDILFEKLGLPTQGIKKGKTGYSTADPELDKLLEKHDIISLIKEYRELAKLQNTYVDVLPGLVNKKTNRIHTTFNQAVTTTGRLSSSEPNLQNIPNRTALGREVRKAFIAEPSNVLISADYSQIELRIVASLAKDKKMLEIFQRGEDIHTATAAAINGVKISEVTKDMRYAAKEVNFGVLYGMGVYGLSWRTKIPTWQAKEFIDKYFSEFAGVKKYLDETIKFAHEEGYVETLFGRRRYIPELLSGNYQLKNAGERMAINMPIQGTAADLMKLAMIEVHNKISQLYHSREDENPENKNVRMILQVHDEIVLEVKKDQTEEISKLVEEAMKNVVELRVPIEIHVKIGQKWGELE